MKTTFYLLIVLAVLTSACTSTSSRTSIESDDLVIISGLDFFPSKNIKPGDTLLTRLEIENVGQTSAKVAFGDDNADEIFFDYCRGLYTMSNHPVLIGSPLEDGILNLDTGKIAILQWTLNAPSSEQLLNLNHKCDFKFKVTYNSSAKTNTFVYFASPLEIAQRIYTSEDLNLKGDNIASFGPVFINFETPQQPIPAGEGKSWSFFVSVFNAGSGVAEIDSLEIEMPETYGLSEESFDSVTCFRAFDFDAGSNSLKFNKEKANAENLLKVGPRSTSKMSCSVSTPEGVTILQPFQFVSSANFTYSLREEERISVGKEVA